MSTLTLPLDTDARQTVSVAPRRRTSSSTPRRATRPETRTVPRPVGRIRICCSSSADKTSSGPAFITGFGTATSAGASTGGLASVSLIRTKASVPVVAALFRAASAAAATSSLGSAVSERPRSSICRVSPTPSVRMTRLELHSPATVGTKSTRSVRGVQKSTVFGLSEP